MDKNYIIISIDTEEAFDKIQHRFLIKTFNKQGIEGNFFNLLKDIYGKAKANVILNGVKLNVFPLRSRTRQEYILEVLATTIRQEKEIKGIQIRKEVKLSPFADYMILYKQS